MSFTVTVAPSASITLNGQTIASYGSSTAPVLVELFPEDNSNTAPSTGAYTARFDQNVQFGTGDIIFETLNSGWQEVETFDVESDVGDGNGQVEIIDDTLYVRPTSARTPDEEYSIRIEEGAIENTSGTAFAGILDNITWTFWIAVSAGEQSAPIYNGSAPDLTITVDEAMTTASMDTYFAGPDLSYGATGLPTGLSINTSTGDITGTPTGTGTSEVTVTATSSGGTADATFDITVEA